jgi:histidine phosphotransferase ChpT
LPEALCGGTADECLIFDVGGGDAIRMNDHNIDPLELAALVASRVCHDIISPVGAIVNGLEVLEEEKDESMREFAQDLVQKSARQASAKLQFSRLAFGASGGAGAELDMADAGRCAAALMEREKPELDWQVKAGLLPKAEAKLLLNLLIIALNCVARGGTITVNADRDGNETVMRVVAEGDRAKLPAGVKEVIAEGAMPNPLDAHAVQPLYAALLAKEAKMAVTATQEENRVVFAARPAA